MLRTLPRSKFSPVAGTRLLFKSAHFGADLHGRFVKAGPNTYLTPMFKAFDFCPTKSTNVPSGPGWLHEIKYDGYRLRIERDGDRVRLITRNGHNWTGRYPWIVRQR